LRVIHSEAPGAFHRDAEVYNARKSKRIYDLGRVAVRVGASIVPKKTKDVDVR
jgi:hypothetical protein